MQLLQSAGITLLSFAVLISIVVFFHELGHLVVGKLCGVKAIRFSIGFGPRLAGFQWGETEYRLSALPLGGYVKFAGDNPLEELPPADRGRGFLEAKPAHKAAIAFAGPAANFVLALFIYFFLCLLPHRDTTTAVGYVKPGSPAAQAGLSYGDKLVAVDGEPVASFMGLQEKIRAHAGEALSLEVEREGARRTVRIVPAAHEETNPLETVRRGRIGISSVPRAAEVALTSPASAAASAGLRDFDLIARLDGAMIGSYEQLEQAVAKKLGQGATRFELEVLHRREVQAPGAVLWAQDPAKLVLEAPAGAKTLGDLGVESADLSLFGVKPGSAAAEAGLLRGDRLVAVQGQPLVAWDDDLEVLLRGARDGALELRVLRAGQPVTVTVHQHLSKGRDEAGARTLIPELGAAPDPQVFSAEPERMWIRWSPPEAARRAVEETGAATRQMVLGIYRIITGHISSEVIGGPLMIADVARKAADDGWQSFMLTMALISMNLGLMNLIPVPVLDGFHVLSAGIEGISRRPLSLRFREVANMVGLALVLSLMLFALKNDVVRKVLE